MGVAETTIQTRPATRAADWIFTTPLPIITAAVITLPAVLYGISGTVGVNTISRIAPDPMHPTYKAHYLLGSPLGFWAQWALQVDSPDGYVLMHFAALIAAIIGSTLMLRHYWSETAARYMLIAWTLSPLSAIETGSLGQPDPSTIFAAAAIIAGPAGWCVVGGMLLGFNHFEQGVFITAFAGVLRPGRSWSTAVAAISGLIAGKILLEWYHHAAGIVGDARLDMARSGGSWEPFARQAVAVTWSVYGLMWVAVLWAAREGARRFLIVTGVAMLPVLFTTDLTRVWALLTWPAVLALCYWITERDSPQVRRAALWLLVAAVVIPRANVWTGGQVITAKWW